MPQMINTGKEIIRINPTKNAIEASTTSGRHWVGHYIGSSCGTFIDLLQHDGGIVAAIHKGLYYSSNEGRSWVLRYIGSSCGTF